MQSSKERAEAARKLLEGTKLLFGDERQIRAIEDLAGEDERLYAIGQLAGKIPDTCPVCEGSGSDGKQTCSVCSGDGVVILERDQLQKMSLAQIRALIGKRFDETEPSDRP